MAALQLRAGRALMTTATTPTSLSPPAAPKARLHPREVTLLDLLDRLLAGGVVVRGEITLAAAGIDLVDLDLALLLASVGKLMAR